MIAATSVGLTPLQGILACIFTAAAFALLCTALVTKERFWRTLAWIGCAVETIAVLSALLAFLTGGVH